MRVTTIRLKATGCFRTLDKARTSCEIRNGLSTARKTGQDALPLGALLLALLFLACRSDFLAFSPRPHHPEELPC